MVSRRAGRFAVVGPRPKPMPKPKAHCTEALLDRRLRKTSSFGNNNNTVPFVARARRKVATPTICPKPPPRCDPSLSPAACATLALSLPHPCLNGACRKGLQLMCYNWKMCAAACGSAAISGQPTMHTCALREG